MPAPIGFVVTPVRTGVVEAPGAAGSWPSRRKAGSVDQVIAVTSRVATSATGRHLQYAGLIVAGLGAIALIVAGALGAQSLSRRSGVRMQEMITVMIAGLLLGVGFLIDIIGLHHG